MNSIWETIRGFFISMWEFFQTTGSKIPLRLWLFMLLLLVGGCIIWGGFNSNVQMTHVVPFKGATKGIYYELDDEALKEFTKDEMNNAPPYTGYNRLQVNRGDLTLDNPQPSTKYVKDDSDLLFVDTMGKYYAFKTSFKCPPKFQIASDIPGDWKKDAPVYMSYFDPSSCKLYAQTDAGSKSITVSQNTTSVDLIDNELVDTSGYKD